MAFPERDYYPLKMLQLRWDVPWDDVTYVIEKGLLRACVHLPMRWMEYGHHEESKFIVDKSVHCEGWVALQAKDTRRIFARGENTICTFASLRRDAYLLRVATEPHQRPLKILLEELVVQSKDCLLFEETHHVEVQDHVGKVRLLRASASSPMALPASVFNNNYQNIQIGDQSYRLGGIQAKVIRKLHQAALAGEPWIHSKMLLSEAGSTCPRLRDIFRAQPIWKALIESDGRGYYRLNLPVGNEGQLRHAG